MIGYLSLIIGIIIHTNGCTKSRNEKIFNIYINRIAKNVELITNNGYDDEKLLFKKLRLYLEFIILDKTEPNNLEFNELRNDIISNLIKKISIIDDLIKKLQNGNITEQEKRKLFLLLFIVMFFERLDILVKKDKIIDLYTDDLYTIIVNLTNNNDIVMNSKYANISNLNIIYYTIIELRNLTTAIEEEIEYLLNILNDLYKI